MKLKKKNEKEIIGEKKKMNELKIVLEARKQKKQVMQMLDIMSNAKEMALLFSSLGKKEEAQKYIATFNEHEQLLNSLLNMTYLQANEMINLLEVR